MRKAVFFDRDGVINKLVLNPETGEFEPPHSPEDLVLFPDAISSLCTLQDAGFDLFLASNQPDYAKGKTTLDQITAVHEKFDGLLKENGIIFRDYYYCYHHPQGIIPEYSFKCKCRKPEPYFLLKAAKNYDIDLSGSWMIGDRDSDIECGKTAGTRTILIENQDSAGYRETGVPDFYSDGIRNAVRIILEMQTEN